MNALKKTVNIPLVFLAAAALLVVVYQAGAMRQVNQAQAQPVRAAVVDLEKVFEQLHERAAEDANLKVRGELLEAEDKERLNKITAMGNDLEALVAGTPKYAEAEEKYIYASMEYRVWKEFELARLEREKGLIFEKLYRRVKDAVKEMAQDRYDIVLMNDSIKELMRGTDQQVGMQISARRILYAHPTLDITADLITRMNNEFQNRAGGTSG